MMLTLLALISFAQKTAAQSLKLEDMSSFKQQAGNWQIVGDVTMNPYVDTHHETAPQPISNKKEKKKNKSTTTAISEQPKAVTFQPGKGILLNINDESKKDNLVSNWEHGNIELELEVMLPKGSNSGIYLQGRYEVQLLDSWGVNHPKYSDIGGIYRNWEKEPGKIYMGKAPLSNPSKAPGLWQKLKISFHAPKFDGAGKKIANARFASVELNGVKIHDNVEVPLPTGGPIENNEKPMGPLMIQGDHGPVAFRNITYRLMKDADISLSNISYKTYYGNFKSTSDYVNQKPAASGTQQALSCEILEKENAYGSTYTGDISVPEDGDYEFNIRISGGGSVKIDNQELVSIQRAAGWIEERKTISLKAGKHKFEIQNFKDVGWIPPMLGLWVQTATTYSKALHAFNSFPPRESPTAPILINAGSQPKLLRAFVDFKGDRAQRLTHTIGVGDASGINYVYDLKAGNLVCVWRGDFVDATPMWNDRGDGSFRPLGAAQYLSTSQPLAFLANETEAFPKTSVEGDFKGKGYEINDSTSRPTFKYIYKGLEVEDKVYPEDNNRLITHKLTIKNRGDQKGLYYKLAEGNSILTMPDGSYAIDDKQYYIKPDASVKAVIREVNGVKELIVNVTGSTVKYSVIW